MRSLKGGKERHHRRKVTTLNKLWQEFMVMGFMFHVEHLEREG